MWYIVAALVLMVFGAVLTIPRGFSKVAAKSLFSTAKKGQTEVETDKDGNEFVRLSSDGKVLPFDQAKRGQLVGYRGKKGKVHIGTVKSKTVRGGKERVVIALGSGSLRGKGHKLLQVA